MLITTSVFKPGDTLINDRGFIGRMMTNILKSVRGVDTYIPVRKNMDIYSMAVSTAIEQKEWVDHPNVKRKPQMIAFVHDLGAFWESEDPDLDAKVPLNACVVGDRKKGEPDEYFVFVTTGTGQTAKSIIEMYELCPKIGEPLICV